MGIEDLGRFAKQDNTYDPLSVTAVAKKSLVIYFLVDTSGSMQGTKMGELNSAMEELIPEIRRIGQADTEVKAAVLTFASNVGWMHQRPVSIEEFEWVRLRADGTTAMGAAFDELNTKLSRSEFMDSPSVSFAPVIFLLTDGYPSDDYQEALRNLRTNSWFKFGLKAALGIGSDTNDEMLAEFTGDPDTVVHAVSGNKLAQLIKVIAITSAQIGSKNMTLSGDGSGELSSFDVYGTKQNELAQNLNNISVN